MLTLQRIEYDDLNPKQKEIHNFQKVAANLADYGFNCIKLSDDWQGADFIAYHKDGNETLKVQLKARLTIDKKYADKNLFMAFPVVKQHNKNWYLIEHDELVDLISQHTQWLDSNSWLEQGHYSSSSPNKILLSALESTKL